MAEVTGMRNNALPYPVYGVAFTIVAPLLDADGDPISPSSPDSEVSKNGDTFADCTNEATEIATSSGICYLLLTAAEMTADIVTVRIQSTGAKTTVMTLYPRKLVVVRTGTCQGANDTGDIQLDSSASAVDDYYNGCLCVAVIDSTTEARIINDYVGSTKVGEVSPAWNTAQPDSNDTFTIYAVPESSAVIRADAVSWLGTTIAAADTAGYPKVTIKDGTGTGEIDTTSGGVLVAAIAANAITATAINADALTAAKFAADVTTELQSGLATAAELAKVPKSDGTASWNATALAALQSEANDALVAYDPPTRAEATSDVNSVLSAIDGIEAQNDDIYGIVKALGVPHNEIGDTGNDTTHVHLPNFGYGDDEINDQMLAIFDDDQGEYHFRWISDWVNATKLATVATLPFTPQNDTDLAWVLSIRRDVTAASIAADAVNASALATDAITEIWAKAMSDLAAVPGATATALDALNWLFELARNKVTQTATTGTLMKDDGSTTLATTTVSDDSTTFVRSEWT